MPIRKSKPPKKVRQNQPITLRGIHEGQSVNTMTRWGLTSKQIKKLFEKYPHYILESHISRLTQDIISRRIESNKAREELLKLL